MRLRGQEGVRALRFARYGDHFIRRFEFDLLDGLIAAGFIACGRDGEWRITKKGQRSLRARQAAVRSAERRRRWTITTVTGNMEGANHA